GAPIMLVRKSFAEALQQPNVTVKADFEVERFDYPSVNVVAKAAGTDPKLRNEYVLFSGHHDHDGVGNPVNQDSIWNGADDNASVTVGMLAIARAWTAKPGKRSALFIWHGAEERGLLGSKWYAAHLTVDKQAIVAVLNGDMISRNSVDSAALLGTLSHKNSTALVDMAMKANASLTHFNVDFSWDDAKHPENWYFRSDHAPYAAIGIPAIFFTSLLHLDYHTPKDEPGRINLTKLTKMTKWMYATGWMVSQSETRVELDKK
ncbi:M28 family peptidase, partial [Mucilaginibacter sp.]|uniref:M28 family metallopeptidase n=1 Tax=Mucilaginibacter sp. TaxID=1882438 RepID=UPI0026356FCB